MKKNISNVEYVFEMPKSMCVVWDVFYMISTNPNRAQLGRLFAALWGCMVTNHPSKPKYSLSDCDLLAYGGKMQEWLSVKKVSPIDVLTIGTELFQKMSEHIATEPEVEQAENFSIDPSEES